MTIELAFPASYDVQELDELPPSGGMREFARKQGSVVDGGVLVEVFAQAGTWTGVVANARASVAAAHTGIYSTPSPGVACVVARGDAYFIDAERPERWWVLDDRPVVAVRSAVAERLLVFATPREIVAVGSEGVVWRTPRLAIDGIQLGEPASGELPGVADPRDEGEAFVIDLRTGRHTGGRHFPD